MTSRIVRTRPQLKNKFEIDFKLSVTGPGITDEEAVTYVKECMRYASAAYMFEVRHPIGERDRHGRVSHNTCGGSDFTVAIAQPKLE